MKRRLIAVDWDGTIVRPITDPLAGNYYPGALEALDLLTYAYDVQIWTDRANEGPHAPGLRPLRAALDAHGLERVGFWTGQGKPPAHRFIDNRAIRFRGDWAEILPLLGIGGYTNG